MPLRRRPVGGGLAAFIAAALIGVVLVTPANASFPGHNGKLAFVRNGDIWTMNSDGTDQVNLTNTALTESNPTWSPNGKRIAFDRKVAQGDSRLFTMLADGTNVLEVTTEGLDPAWSPDGNQLVYIGGIDGAGPFLMKVNVDGTGKATISGGRLDDVDPEWSPDGSKIVYSTEIESPCVYGLISESPAGGDGSVIACDGHSFAQSPNWSPNGTRVVFAGIVTGGEYSMLMTIKPDGSDEVMFPDVPGYEPAYSPDGERLVYMNPMPSGEERITTVNADGTGIVDLAAGVQPDWQPIPINSYARPKGATPFRASLTTAYTACSAPNRTHGPPLAFPSCDPTQQTSSYLTVGTADANAKPALNEGYLRLDTIVGSPGGPDDSDVGIDFFMDDVFTKAPLADYGGELRARVVVQITDKDNTPSPGGPGAATTEAIPLDIIASCVPVADVQEGSTCTTTTSADAIAPGTVKEGRRAMWQLGRVEVYDGGADGDTQTAAGDTLFATQGIFVP